MPDAPPSPPAVEGLSFEQALAELERIVGQLESGQAELEQSVSLYQRGSALKAHCETKLSEARLKVERIVLGGDGRPSGAEPADFG